MIEYQAKIVLLFFRNLLGNVILNKRSKGNGKRIYFISSLLMKSKKMI